MGDVGFAYNFLVKKYKGTEGWFYIIVGVFMTFSLQTEGNKIKLHMNMKT